MQFEPGLPALLFTLFFPEIKEMQSRLLPTSGLTAGWNVERFKSNTHWTSSYFGLNQAIATTNQYRNCFSSDAICSSASQIRIVVDVRIAIALYDVPRQQAGLFRCRPLYH